MSTDIAHTQAAPVDATATVRQFMERFSADLDPQMAYDPSDVTIYADSDEE